MALITRVSRLFRADIHAVLDRMEEPELLLKQAVREMEQQIAGRRHDLGQRLQETQEEMDLCFDTGNESLLRALLKRKLETERFAKFLDRKQEV